MPYYSSFDNSKTMYEQQYSWGVFLVAFGIFLRITYVHAPGSCESQWWFPVIVWTSQFYEHHQQTKN